MFGISNQNFLSVKTLQKFVVYIIIGCAIALLFTATADSKTSILYPQVKDNHSKELVESTNQKTYFDTTKENQNDKYQVSLISSPEERASTNNSPKNTARLKNTFKVTHENSDCARELRKVLSRYMSIGNISASWSYGDRNYIYEAGSSNYRSLNKNLLTKSKSSSSNSLLASTTHQQINQRMIYEVQSTFRSHGVQINQLQANGEYKSDGTPCTLSFPCSNDSYCVL